jgi:hypothetical protein
MVSVTKIRIKDNTKKETFFEKGKDSIKSIKMDIATKTITLRFEKDSEWEYEVIPIGSFESIEYNVEKTQLSTSHRKWTQLWADFIHTFFFVFLIEYWVLFFDYSINSP